MEKVLTNRSLFILLIIVIIGILGLGLWPFGYPIPNRVALLSDPPGLRFEGVKGRAKLDAGGVVYTPEPLKIQRTERSASGSITVEIKVKAALEFTSGVGRIVAIRDEKDRLRVMLGQWRSHLIIRTYYFATNKRGPFTEIGVRDVLVPGKTGLITVTSDQNKTTIYYEGELARRVEQIRLLPELVDFSGYRVYLGNDPDTTAPWQGEFYGLALYDHTLTADEVFKSYRNWSQNPQTKTNTKHEAGVKYNFVDTQDAKVPSVMGDGNALIIPERFLLKQRMLERAIFYRVDEGDIVNNVLAFIPVGFLGVLWLRQLWRRSIVHIALLVILAGFGMSFGIELAQAYMPTRSSAMVDLVCNTMGTVVGIFAACIWARKGKSFTTGTENTEVSIIFSFAGETMAKEKNSAFGKKS